LVLRIVLCVFSGLAVEPWVRFFLILRDFCAGRLSEDRDVRAVGAIVPEVQGKLALGGLESAPIADSFGFVGWKMQGKVVTLGLRQS
jgi:hypothetical protein